MTLQQLRNWANTPDYAQYQRYQALLESQKNLFSRRTADHEELLHRASEVKQLHDLFLTTQALNTAAQNKLAQITAEYKQNFDKLQHLNVLSAFYKEALEDITHQYLDELSKTLTEVYSTVYSQTNKQVQLVLEDYRGQKVVRLKYLKTYEGNLYSESLDADGGSAQIILGTIIAVYFILATDSPRIIFMDESLSALSTSVLHQFLSVLKRFSTELGFIFYIVDHAPYRFHNYVDQLFTVEDGVYRELKGEALENFLSSTRGDVDD